LQWLCACASARLALTPSALCLEPLEAQLGMDFLAHLETQRGHGPSTRNTRLAAIKALMRFVEDRVPSSLEQSRRGLAIPKKQTAQPLVHDLSRAERQALRDAPEVHPRAGLRDRAMMPLCFAAGLRVSERLPFPRTALTFQPTAMVQVQGTGRRARALPRWRQTADALQAWLAVRGDNTVPYVFLRAHGRAMTRMGFPHVLHKYMCLAAQGCPSRHETQVTPHGLRPTCAMIILPATGARRKVALWLGHADRQTTEGDLRADPTEKIAALAAVVPPPLRRGAFTVPDKLMAS
jgi:integrase/recombinase XerD